MAPYCKSAICLSLLLSSIHIVDSSTSSELPLKKSWNCVHKRHLTRSPPFQELLPSITSNWLQWWQRWIIQKIFRHLHFSHNFRVFNNQDINYLSNNFLRFAYVYRLQSAAKIMNSSSIENDDMICDDVLNYAKLPEGQFWIWREWKKIVPIRNRKWWQLQCRVKDRVIC